ncbi:MAG: hypothetical protein DMG14_25985 [Acidobacteria bacterium]|nr:MAG: hypothetical protein DMG14_25985 [Acidobacteriota bacterium]
MTTSEIQRPRMLRRSQEQNGSHIILAATSLTKSSAAVRVEAFSDKPTPKSMSQCYAITFQ